MNPTISGVIGPAFLNQVPTFGLKVQGLGALGLRGSQGLP